MALARAKRITGQASFRRAQRTGKTLGNKLVALRCVPNQQLGARVAVVIPAKVIARATRRNYLRRRVLHWFAPLLKRCAYPIDIIIQLRSGAVNSTATEIETSLGELIKEANIV